MVLTRLYINDRCTQLGLAPYVKTFLRAQERLNLFPYEAGDAHGQQGQEKEKQCSSIPHRLCQLGRVFYSLLVLYHILSALSLFQTVSQHEILFQLRNERCDMVSFSVAN